MSSKCIECDHLLADDVEYLYKGKSYCYRAIKKLEIGSTHFYYLVLNFQNVC